MDIQDSRRLARTASEESLLRPISDIERLFDDMEGQASGQASSRRQVSAKPSALKSNQVSELICSLEYQLPSP